MHAGPESASLASAGRASYHTMPISWHHGHIAGERGCPNMPSGRAPQLGMPNVSVQDSHTMPQKTSTSWQMIKQQATPPHHRPP
jgi:hypothetical protein